MNRLKLNLSFGSINSATDFNFTILNPAGYIGSVNSTIIELGTVKYRIALLDVS